MNTATDAISKFMTEVANLTTAEKNYCVMDRTLRAAKELYQSAFIEGCKHREAEKTIIRVEHGGNQTAY